MRILWDFTFASNGGALTSLEDFMEFLSKGYHNNLYHIVLLRMPAGEKLDSSHSKVITIPQNSILGRLRFLFGINKVIRDEKIDFVVFPGGLPNPLIRTPFAFSIRQAIYFCDSLGEISRWNRFLFSLRKLTLRIAAKRATHLFVQTEYMKHKVLTEFRPCGSVDVVTWNVSNELSQSFSHNERESCEPTRFLYVSLPNGRPYKNHLNLLRGFNLVLEKGLKAELILTCPRFGESRDITVNKIHQEIKRLCLEKHVVLTGQLSRGDALKLYSNADIFVFPSKCESFGVPLLEAMACGLPIAAADTLVIHEVTHNCGIYFDAEEPSEIAEAMVRAEQSIGVLSESSRTVFERFYSQENIWESILEAIMANAIDGESNT